jgi:hypothetical protein
MTKVTTRRLIVERHLHSANSSRIYAQSSSDFYTRSLGSVTQDIAVRGKLSSSRPRKDEYCFDLISGALPFGGLVAIGLANRPMEEHTQDFRGAGSQ